MNAATLAALHGSIAKWERIAAGVDSDRGSQNCPLCKFFYSNGPLAPTVCDGCPVKAATAKTFCAGTPYLEFINHVISVHNAIDRRAHQDCPDCVRLATAELEFLRSLLPPTSEAFCAIHQINHDVVAGCMLCFADQESAETHPDAVRTP